VATICSGLTFWGRERAGDFFAALEWVRRQPWADASRIVAVGWSHGGWTVLDALAFSSVSDAEAAIKLSGLPEDPLAGLVGAFLLYPYVGVGSLARTRGLMRDVGPLVVVGSRDAVAGGRRLQRTLERMRTPGRPVRVAWLDGATHAFDEPDTLDFRTHYDPALAEKAQGMLKEYLAHIGS
jgi:dienelactone hydrolase